MIRLDVDVRPLQRLVDRLNTGYRRTKTSQHGLALKVAQAMKELAERRVAVTKTAPDGTPWRGWAPSYAATRSSKHSLLVDTRELLKGFVASATPSGRLARLENTAEHAVYVQKERPFMGVGPKERDAAEDQALMWLDRAL